MTKQVSMNNYSNQLNPNNGSLQKIIKEAL